MDINLFRKALASRTKTSLLNEDLRADLKKYGASTGGWVKLTSQHAADYVDEKDAKSLSGAEEIYVYDDEEGGHYNPILILAKVKNQFVVVSGDNKYQSWRIKKFSNKNEAIQFVVKYAALERI